MASIEVKVEVVIEMTLTQEEIDELGDQLSFLINDNRSTDVTRDLLSALNRAGY